MSSFEALMGDGGCPL